MGAHKDGRNFFAVLNLARYEVLHLISVVDFDSKVNTVEFVAPRVEAEGWKKKNDLLGPQKTLQVSLRASHTGRCWAPQSDTCNVFWGPIYTLLSLNMGLGCR